MKIEDHDKSFVPDTLPKLDLEHFPETVRKRLVEALVSQQRLWDDMRLEVIDADSPYLRVTLSVSERLLYLFTFPDGKELSYQAPVMVDFPERASHFVLTKSGQPYYPNFVVGEGEGRKQVESATGQRVETSVDVLYGYGKEDFDTFVNEPKLHLVRIIAKMGMAEAKIQQFLDTPPIIRMVA